MASIVPKKRGGNVRNLRTTHPRKTARQQGALDRFKPAGDDAGYKLAHAKAVELEALRRAVGAA